LPQATPWLTAVAVAVAVVEVVVVALFESVIWLYRPASGSTHVTVVGTVLVVVSVLVEYLVVVLVLYTVVATVSASMINGGDFASCEDLLTGDSRCERRWAAVVRSSLSAGKGEDQCGHDALETHID
jgi:hypothetical protein